MVRHNASHPSLKGLVTNVMWRPFWETGYDLSWDSTVLLSSGKYTVPDLQRICRAVHDTQIFTQESLYHHVQLSYAGILSLFPFSQGISTRTFLHFTAQRAAPVAVTRLQTRRGSTNVGSRAYILSPEFPPLYVAQQCLETLHSWTHLPWWAVIVGTTVALRSLVTLPMAVYQNKLVAKIELLQPTLNMMTESLKHKVTVECRRAGMPVEEAENRYNKQVRSGGRDRKRTMNQGSLFHGLNFQ